MNTMCENFDANHDDTLGVDRPFIFACRDRTARCEERWVLASLSNEEAKKYTSIYRNTSSNYQDTSPNKGSFFCIRVRNNSYNEKIILRRNCIMILFTFLITLLLVIAIVTIVFGFVVGAGFIVMFGDVIICALIIALIIRHFMKK